VTKAFSINTVIWRLAIWLCVALILFITAAALLTDYQKVIDLFSNISPSYLIAIVSAVLFNYALRFIKWNWFLGILGIKVPLKLNLWIFFSAFTMVLSPAKIGELVKSFLLKSRLGISVAITAPIVVAERLTDLLGLLILCAIGFSQFAFGGRTLVLVAVVMTAGILAITRPAFWGMLDRILSGKTRLVKLRESIKAMQQSTRDLLSLRSLAFSVPLSALSWGGEGVALYLIFQSMGLELQNLLAISLFAHAFSSIAGAVSFLPGGLLVAEGSMGAFFVYAGIPDAAAVSATFLIRAVTLWFAVILGTIVFMFGYNQGDLQALQRKDETVTKETVRENPQESADKPV
jgi:uncharacterized protein (TIRG00374 family)